MQVERIRHVGTILLAMIQNVDNGQDSSEYVLYTTSGPTGQARLKDFNREVPDDGEYRK
jgi:hypothetical protein